MGDEKVLDYDISAFTVPVDTDKYGKEEDALFNFLNENVIGQPRAARHLADAFTIKNAGLLRPGKPIAVKVFVGPTGVGKTEMAKALSRYLIPVAREKEAPLTRIDCADLQDRHDATSVLLGSPPGYVGYNEPPRLQQYKLDEPHFMLLAEKEIAERFKGNRPKDIEKWTEKLYERLRPQCRSVLLFDEIEKAHASLWDILLTIMDEGSITLKNGQKTSFANTVIILTSNVNGRKIQEQLTEKRIGYAAPKAGSDTASRDLRTYRETLSEFKRTFRPEFVGRVKNGFVVFRPFSRTDKDPGMILDKILQDVQVRVNGSAKGSIPLLLAFTEAFREHVLDEGVSIEYGVRELEHVVRDTVERMLAKAITSGQLWPGDEVLFDLRDGKPVMARKVRTPKQAPIIPTPAITVDGKKPS